MTSFIKYPEIGDNIQYFSYDKLEVAKILTINNNLNILKKIIYKTYKYY